MSLGTSESLHDWLVGRRFCDRDRGPCYERIKRLFVARVAQDTGKKIALPQPPWASR